VRGLGETVEKQMLGIKTMNPIYFSTVRVKIIGWDRMHDQYESKEAGLSIEVMRWFFGSLRGSPG
jgi:hypothetical protein